MTPLKLTCQPETWRIIVVDDDHESLRLVNALFTARGISIVTVDNVLAGLQAIRDGDFNIFLLDIMMPGDATGWELHRELHVHEKLTESILIVAFTGLTEQSDRDRAADLGFEGYLTKPFDPFKIFPLLGAFVGSFLARRGRPCFPEV